MSLVFKIATKKGVPYHNGECVNPFFIVGSGRCGTTLLRRILISYKGVFIPPENWALGEFIKKFKYLKYHDNWDDLVELIVSNHYFNTQKWFTEYPYEIIEKLKKVNKSDRSLALMVDELYRFHAKLNNIVCTTWGDKTPLNVKYLEDISHIFPKARFIHMLRDGVDVVASYQERDNEGIVKPSERWVSTLKSVEKYKNKYPDRILTIKYENLVQFPEENIAGICDFLNIKSTEKFDLHQVADMYSDLKLVKHYENTIEPISTEAIGKGRRNLSKSQLIMLSREFNEYLLANGYERSS